VLPATEVSSPALPEATLTFAREASSSVGCDEAESVAPGCCKAGVSLVSSRAALRWLVTFLKARTHSCLRRAAPFSPLQRTTHPFLMTTATLTPTAGTASANNPTDEFERGFKLLFLSLFRKVHMCMHLNVC
jgi:hypothetical protein